jgi:predicted MPP superfamily phosphohydrolase
MIASVAGVFLWIAVAAAVLAPVIAFVGFRLLQRRGHLRLAWAWIIFIVAAWPLSVWSTFIEPETLVVRRETIAVPRWSGPPVRLGLIADSHVGAPHMDAARMARIVQRMNGEHPDLVLLLGDYVGGHQKMATRSKYRNDQVLSGLAAFKGLTAPLGVVGVIGNHDFWYDKAAVRAGLTAAHVIVLENTAAPIHRPEGDFWVAGLADLDDIANFGWGRQAFSHVPKGAPSILLAHEPDAFAEPHQPYAFMAAGHTHCGQIRLPFLGAIAIRKKIERRLACHLHRRRDQALYVSGGLGVSGLPMRFAAPPEINIITLTSQAGGSTAR